MEKTFTQGEVEKLIRAAYLQSDRDGGASMDEQDITGWADEYVEKTLGKPIPSDEGKDKALHILEQYRDHCGTTTAMGDNTDIENLKDVEKAIEGVKGKPIPSGGEKEHDCTCVFNESVNHCEGDCISGKEQEYQEGYKKGWDDAEAYHKSPTKTS